MSMFGGLSGGSSSDFKPSEAPKVPKRMDTKIENRTMAAYRRLAARDSYATSLLGGSAPAPSKSYAAKLFGPGGM